MRLTKLVLYWRSRSAVAAGPVRRRWWRRQRRWWRRIPKNWLAGGSGTLASSTDGLHYALSASRATSANLWALYCVGSQVGWAAATRHAAHHARRRRPLDGAHDRRDTALRAVAFADPAVGIAVGDNATVLRSADGGVSWTAAMLSGATASPLRRRHITRARSPGSPATA